MSSKEIQDSIEISGEGLYVDLIVKPNSSENKIIGYNEWRKCIEVSVKERAEGGKANSALLELLTNELNISKNNIQLVQGHKSKQKRIFIASKADEIIKRISGIVG